MDAGKPDGVSSSPSDNRIVRIRHEGAAGEVVLVDLSDGSSFFLPAHVLDDEGLAVGLAVPPEGVDRLSFLEDRYRARLKALDLLALNEQSRRRLELKLSRRGFATEAIRQVLDELEGTGALDDLRFARVWMASRIRRNPCGRVKLYAALLNQGLARRVVEEALSDWDDEKERDALERAADRIAARGRKTPEKALRALVALGFSLPQARRALEARFERGLSDRDE